MSYDLYAVTLVTGMHGVVIHPFFPEEKTRRYTPYPGVVKFHAHAGGGQTRDEADGAAWEAWYDDPANRNPEYNETMASINMANGNFADMMDGILDPADAYINEGLMPIQEAIDRLTAWLSRHPDIPGDFDYCKGGWTREGGAFKATLSETTRYLSRRASQILKHCELAASQGAELLGWC